MKLGPRGTLIILFAALALFVPAYIGSFSSGVPTVFSPFPALTIIPALLLAQVHLEYVAALLPSLLFLLWNPQLFREESKIPKMSYVLFVLVVALSAVDFVMSWKCTTPSFRSSLFLHWMLFAWLCWYAFPWLGELL